MYTEVKHLTLFSDSVTITVSALLVVCSRIGNVLMMRACTPHACHTSGSCRQLCLVTSSIHSYDYVFKFMKEEAKRVVAPTLEYTVLA